MELKKRNLPVSGSKPQLIDRLKPFVDQIQPPSRAQSPAVRSAAASPASGAVSAAGVSVGGAAGAVVTATAVPSSAVTTVSGDRGGGGAGRGRLSGWVRESLLGVAPALVVEDKGLLAIGHAIIRDLMDKDLVFELRDHFCGKDCSIAPLCSSKDGTPVCRLCGRYLAILGRPIRVTVPSVTVAPTALVGSLIRSSNLPHSLQRRVHHSDGISL